MPSHMKHLSPKLGNHDRAIVRFPMLQDELHYIVLYGHVSESAGAVESQDHTHPELVLH